MNKRKGISLIVLVITILVMIILAGVVVVSLQKNNPIEKAKEARFKEDLSAIGSELELFYINEVSLNSEFNKETMHADRGKCEYNTSNGTVKNIYEVIPSLKNSKYKNQIEIIQGNLFYRTPDKKEIPWLRELGIHYTGIVTGTVIIEGDTLVGVSSDYVNTGTLVVPSNVKKINQNAFAGCTELAGVIIPEGITEIPNNCFRNCTGLTNVSLPSTITRIGAYAFNRCTNLESIDMPASLKVIDDVAFEECMKLKNVNLNEQLETIGYRAFRRTKVANLDFKQNLKYIKGQAFDTTKVVKVVIPDSVVELGSHAFGWCYDLKEFHIGANTTLGSNVIRYSPVTSITISPLNRKYAVQDNVVYDYSKKNLLFAAQGCTNVTIPGTVIQISDNAFSDCKQLSILNIPASVQTIGQMAVAGCENLNTINVDTNSAYLKADNGIILSKDGSIIYSAANVNTTYNMPNTVKTIKSYAFNKCFKLNTINMSENLKIIEGHAFENCGLTKAVIPGTTVDVGEGAFKNSTELERVEFLNGVQKLGGNMFSGCDKLSTLKIPQSVNSIAGGCIGGTNILSNIEIDPNNEFYKVEGNVIYTKDGTVAVTASDSNKNLILIPTTKVIAEKAFYQNKFTEALLPPSVEKITYEAFSGNKNLRKVTIPRLCTSIGSSTFAGTPNLSEIIIDKNENSIVGSPWGATQGVKAVIWQYKN